MQVFTEKMEYYLEKLRDWRFKGLVLTTESRINFFEMNTTKPPLLKLSFEKLMFPMVFYFPKHSILIESFNIEISKLKSLGIFYKWRSQFQRKIISRKFLESNEATPLNVAQIISFCGYWFAGIICSVLCLSLEVFYWRYGQAIQKLLRIS